MWHKFKRKVNSNFRTAIPITVNAALQRSMALIHKYCSSGATDSPLPHALQRRDSEDYGRLVYSPENLTRQHPSPDWGAFGRGLDRPGESLDTGSFLVT